MTDKPSTVAVQLPDMEKATALATEISMLLNQHDLPTALTAIGNVLGMAVLMFGEEATFDVLRTHARNVVAATKRHQAMLALQCEGSA
jgi:hypothetical protein